MPSPSINSPTQPIIRWGRVTAYAGTRETHSWIASPSSFEECHQVLQLAQKKNLTICTRGSGYSYADMILNNGHIILDLRKMNQVLSWNPMSGTIVVQPGVTFREIFQFALPKNWTLPSCPGGMAVTIGGALSNNVHGKDSWKIGNFGDHIAQFKILNARGEIKTLSRQSDAAAFRTIIGGLGLFGIVLEVTLQLKAIPSAFVEVTHQPVKSLSQCLSVLEEAKGHSDFSVAWVDAFARGTSLGRGFVTTAQWITRNDFFSHARLVKSLTPAKRVFNIFPAKPLWAFVRPLFRPTGIRNVNRLQYFAKTLRGKTMERMLFSEYNFMHNRIPDINHVYHPHGFLEFEPLIPKERGESTLSQVLEMCQRHHCESLLCGLKAHRSDDFTLSFSGDGYSIGIDIQLRGRDPEGVSRFSRDLFEKISATSGKIYLAKDERLEREFFQQMYPQNIKFIKLKNQWDPEHRFCSDLCRRLLMP